MKLYDYNKLIDFTNVELTPKEAIIFKCHECCAFDSTEVKGCNNKMCALFKYKQKWYKTPRKFSEETINKMSERAKSMNVLGKK